MFSHETMVLMVPSRGRPENARRLLFACRDTAPDLPVFIGVDSSDPCLMQYFTLAAEHITPGAISVIPPHEEQGTGMVGALNYMVSVHGHCHDFISFMGDDHLPRTAGWDTKLCHTLMRQGGGIAYGNDLLQGAALPTAVVMSAEIPLTLGYMAPPELKHLYVDDFWKALGEGIGRLTYRDDVVIEHVHPGAGKADWDPEYARTGSSQVNEMDLQAYERYKKYRLPEELEKLRQLV